jgi:hypothetical protein
MLDGLCQTVILVVGMLTVAATRIAPRDRALLAVLVLGGAGLMALGLAGLVGLI